MSVVVPVYRDEAGIRRALDALLRQRYPADRHEVIVVDNGSDDGTADAIRGYVRKHPERIRLEIETAIQDSYAARNRGVAAARGEVLAFTDADCEPVPGWIAEGVRTLRDTGAAYAAGRVAMTFRAPEPNLWEYYDAVAKLNQRRYIEDFGFGATANLFVAREAFRAVGGFREDLISGGDYEFGRRLVEAGEASTYAEAATVRHPARATAGAVLKKERRVTRGRRRLAELGLLEHWSLGWRSFVPVRRWRELDGVRVGPFRRVALLLVFNFVRYYSLAITLVEGLKRLVSFRKTDGPTG